MYCEARDKKYTLLFLISSLGLILCCGTYSTVAFATEVNPSATEEYRDARLDPKNDGVLPSIASDDFNYCTLDTMWTPVDPLGDGTITVNGTQVIMSVPGGTDHSAWGTSASDFENNTLRIMQPANNTDFQVVVKFESGVTETYQEQGISSNPAQSYRFAWLLFLPSSPAVKIPFVRRMTNVAPRLDRRHVICQRPHRVGCWSAGIYCKDTRWRRYLEPTGQWHESRNTRFLLS